MEKSGIEVTPRMSDLVYESLLKSFWRKQALKAFLRDSSIHMNMINSWGENETKRQFLDRLFNELGKHPKGKAVIKKIAFNLSEQNTFPDLRGWEDSNEKIQEATKALNELKYYIKKIEDQKKDSIEKEKSIKAAQEFNNEIRRSVTDREALQQELYALQGEIGTQKGGYQFEEWFYKVLDFSDIQNRPPYKTDGRQIDGSLTLDGTTYLVELKFTKNQTGSEDIDIFKAKIDKMADNTMGIFISMSGYSSQAIKEASGRKTTLMLFDSAHIFLFLQGIITLDDIIRRSRRHVSQTSEAFLIAQKFH